MAPRQWLVAQYVPDAFGALPPAVPSFPSNLPCWRSTGSSPIEKGLIEQVEAHDSALARIASDHLPLKAAVRTDLLAA